MGIVWNLYFIAKLYLFHVEFVRPVWLANIALALAVLLPLERRWLRVLRQIVCIVAGAALLYSESPLPPVSRALTQLPTMLRGFSPGYLLELLARLVTPNMLMVALLALVAYLLINRWLRVTTFVLGALIITPLWYGAGLRAVGTAPQQTAARTAAPAAGASAAMAAGPGEAGGYESQLKAFRQLEVPRTVAFSPLTTAPDAQFDIIVLQICSLSWDDLDAAKGTDHPLFARFDYLFRNFSAAASYSGPAVIRLMRAACGQQAHQDLYQPAPEGCHLFEALAGAGFKPGILMNHDGRFDNFREFAIKEIGVPGVTLAPKDGATVAMRAFDDAPVYEDYEVFERWYQSRLANDKGPVALFYNSVSMHDGNRLPGRKLSSLESYPLRLTRLLDDIDKMTALIAKSGRKAVVVFVPEHGAALRGDPFQIAGLREIPTPHIIHVPVGVKLIGLPAATQTGMVTIEAPSSYLALAQLISNLVADSPFRQGAPGLPQYAADLPQTRMVGENEATVTMAQANGGYAMRNPDGTWVERKP